MKILYKFHLLLALLFPIKSLLAQDITGCWEGDLASAQFLQVNIVQVKDNLCGYTWDYTYDNKSSFCKAYFTGYYERTRKEWILTGTSFISSSGDHILMQLRLKSRMVDGEIILEGTESDPENKGLLSFLYRQAVLLKKVSKKPARMLPNMVECVKELKKIKKDTAAIAKGKPDERDKKKVVVPVKPVETVKKPANPEKKVIVPVKPVETKRTDTLKKIMSPAIPVIKDSSQLVKSMADRKNKEMKRLVVNEKNIVLDVYDNGIVDSDTVSIFYNGKLILGHKRLSEKPIIIPITLDEKTTTHEITLFAENLGSIPPNTALIVVKAGDKRYELYASASFTENAVIVFEYKPK